MWAHIMSEEHIVGILMTVVVTQNSFPHSQGGEQGKGASLSEYLSHIVAPRHKTSTLGHRVFTLSDEISSTAPPPGPATMRSIHVYGKGGSPHPERERERVTKKKWTESQKIRVTRINLASKSVHIYPGI